MIFRILQHSALWIATTIIVLHTVMPHIHHAEKAPLESHFEQTPKDFPDLLGLVFHITNPGAGHLEHILLQNQQVASTDVIAISVSTFQAGIPLPFSLRWAKAVAIPLTFQTPRLFSQGHPAPWSLRGPPALV